MTSQKTIEKCRIKVKDLEETNKTLLGNNVRLSEENAKLHQELSALKDETKNQCMTIVALTKEKDQCKRKCEVVIGEKNRILNEKEQALHDAQLRLQRIQDMKDIRWSHSMNGGKIVLTGEL